MPRKTGICNQRIFTQLQPAHNKLAGYRLSPRPVEIPPCLSFRHWSASNVPSLILHQQLHVQRHIIYLVQIQCLFYDIYQMRCGSKECTIRAFMMAAK